MIAQVHLILGVSSAAIYVAVFIRSERRAPRVQWVVSGPRYNPRARGRGLRSAFSQKYEKQDFRRKLCFLRSDVRQGFSQRARVLVFGRVKFASVLALAHE